MGLVSGFLSLLSGGFVKDVGDAIDKNVTSDEERLKLHNELAQINERMVAKSQDVAVEIEKNVTARHDADMKSDNQLAKNVRPVTLVVLTFFTLCYMIVPIFKELTEYQANAYEASLAAIISLDMLVYGFYFGSRGAEKVAAKIAEGLGKGRIS